VSLFAQASFKGMKGGGLCPRLHPCPTDAVTGRINKDPPVKDTPFRKGRRGTQRNEKDEGKKSSLLSRSPSKTSARLRVGMCWVRLREKGINFGGKEVLVPTQIENRGKGGDLPFRKDSKKEKPVGGKGKIFAGK